jgi:spore coat protein U-like protein
MKLSRWACATLALSAASTAHAATKTETLAVTMTVTATCVVNAGTLNFGSQTALPSAVDQQGTFTVNCSNTTPYTIALDAGQNGSGSVTARRMRGGASGTDYVNYALFTNTGRTTNWGTTAGTDTVAKTGTGASDTVTVYGRVPAQAINSPGSYSDNVTITVTY